MLQLALPVVLTYLGLMLMGVVDVIFVGHVGATSIGAVGVGTSLFSWVMVFGLGLLAGLDYLVSFAEGAGRGEDGHQAMVQSLIACTVLSLPMTLALIFMAQHLEWIGVNPAVRPEASQYLGILAFSLWPTLAFSACRQYLTARGVAAPALVILLLANVMNALSNYALIFGHWGLPALGTSGSALATLTSRLVMLAAIFTYLGWWDRRHERLFERLPIRLDLKVMRELMRLGIPSGLQMCFEIGVFALSTTLAARLEPIALAAHLIVLNIASLTFMVPLGVSSATAVLVGQAIGRGAPRKAEQVGWHGLALGVGYMAFSGLVLFSFSLPILSLFTTDPEVRELASKIILIAALFQLSDGTQVVGTGALRGLGETRSPMIANLCGHWLVGLPVGLLLCFRLGWGLQGLWTGLSLGLTIVATFVLISWRLRSREYLSPTLRRQ